MKTTILIPTFNNAIALANCFKFLHNLEPQPSLYIILENNSVDKTLELIIIWKRHHPNTQLIRLWFRKDAVQVLGNPYAMIGTIRQILLDRARNLSPDYAIFIDDDIFLGNKDFIERITGWHKDLVGAPYLRKFPEGMFIASKWINVNPNRKEYAYTLKRQACGFQEVYMTSGGALCISNKLLQDKRVNFMPILTNEETSEDFGYCIKARKHGYKVYLDGTLKMGHMIRNTGNKAWTINKEGKYIDFKYPESKT